MVEVADFNCASDFSFGFGVAYKVTMLTAEARKRAIASIRQYFSKELELEIGDLKAGLVLDFFLAEVAPSVHNAAIERAQAYVRDRLADLDGACTLPEFGYWTTRK